MKKTFWVTHNFNIPGLLYFSMMKAGGSTKTDKAFIREISNKETPEAYAMYWSGEGNYPPQGSRVWECHQKEFTGLDSAQQAQRWCEELFEKEYS